MDNVSLIGSESGDTNFFSELTKISHSDHIGKDLCVHCHKTVAQNHQAISCDKCDRWTHRACTYIDVNKYRTLKQYTSFPWLCKNCKPIENNNDDICEIFLDAHEMPQSLEHLKDKNCNFLIIHLNCRSLLYKEEELVKILLETGADIICLTETWFDQSVPLEANVPNGYKIIRKDRTDDFRKKYGKSKNGKGGGVAVLYKKNLKVVVRNDLSHPVEDFLWVQVKSSTNFLLGVLYRPDYSNFFKENSNFEDHLQKVLEKSKNIIITGDFNIDLLADNCKETKNLKNCLHTYGFIQHVKKPTRICPGTFKKSLLDHFWTSNDQIKVKDSGTFVGVSDHFGTFLNLNLKKPKIQKRKIKFRSFKNYKSDLFNNDLTQALNACEINTLLKNKDVNQATNLLVKKITEIANKHAPLCEKKIGNEKSEPPWYTPELTNAIQNKNEILTDFLKTRNPSFKLRLKIESKKIARMKTQLKKSYIIEKLEEYKNDVSKLWKLLNFLSGRQKGEKVEPECLSQQKVDENNHFFATVGIRVQEKLGGESGGDTAPRVDKLSPIEFAFKKETQKNIAKLFDSLKNNVATGIDSLNAKIIKDSKFSILPYITEIINLSFETGVFPDCMKVAIICPIFKEGDPDDITNYRPISILPIISKIFERAAANQIVDFLEKNNLLNQNQHAYRKGHSTETCLFELMNDTYKNLDKKLFVAVAKLDLSKAFDSISHDLLLQKMKTLGLENSALNWIKSYLTERKQVTQFKNFTSSTEIIKSGVPQGSILGPLLFLCYVNDLPNAFDGICKMLAYADDTQLLVSAKTKKELKVKLEAAMKAAQNWYSNNFMLNNVGKTDFLIFSPQRKNETLDCDIYNVNEKKTISSKSEIEILGVYIDSNLKFTKQINQIKKKAFNTTRQIHRINYFLPMEQKLMLYNTIIAPLFNYGDVIWGGCDEKDSKSLQKIQNFAARSINGKKKYDSATESLKKLKLLDLKTRRKVHEAVFAHKALSNKTAKNTCQIFESYRPKTETRKANLGKLNIPTHTNAKFQKCPTYRCIKTWNSMPSGLPDDDIQKRKRAHQKYLIEKLYS